MTIRHRLERAKSNHRETIYWIAVCNNKMTERIEDEKPDA